ITFKCIFTLASWNEYQVIEFALVEVLGIGNPIIIMIISIVTNGADKFFIKDRDKIIVNIYYLIHATQHFYNTFIFYSIGICSLYYFSAFYRVILEIIIRKNFSKISREV